MKNYITKLLRNISIKYCYAYQNKVFKIYLKKYIKKYEKLLTNHKNEHNELLPYLDVHADDIKVFCAYLRLYKDDIIKLLTYYYCINRQTSSKYRIYYLEQYKTVRERIDETIKHLVYVNFIDNLPVQYKTNDIIRFFLDKSCEVASLMRYGFLVSDVTAKTKTTEHWISRLPLFLICTVLIVIGKSYMYIWFNDNEYMFIIFDVLTSVCVGIIAIFLVFMRVPQSIYADAKKSASDVYIVQKTKLHFYLLNQTTETNVVKYYNQVYDDFFSHE
jgi:hypothetical protein